MPEPQESPKSSPKSLPPSEPSASLDPLVRDLVAWVARGPRPYADVIEAWRTSCPRLTVWEEATERGLVTRRAGPDGAEVVVTPAGERFLAGYEAARA
jgi:hypothetical protein